MHLSTRKAHCFCYYFRFKSRAFFLFKWTWPLSNYVCHFYNTIWSQTRQRLWYSKGPSSGLPPHPGLALTQTSARSADFLLPVFCACTLTSQLSPQKWCHAGLGQPFFIGMIPGQHLIGSPQDVLQPLCFKYSNPPVYVYVRWLIHLFQALIILPILTTTNSISMR